MVQVGQQAPDFTLTDTAGQDVKLSSFQGKPVVLAFFPKAFTGTCERQLSEHQHRLAEFTALGAQVVAISTDQSPSQKAFAANCGVDGFPILSDFRHQVVQAYGIHRPTGGAPNERATFIIDRDGKVAYSFVEPVIGNWQGIDPELTELRKMGQTA